MLQNTQGSLFVTEFAAISATNITQFSDIQRAAFTDVPKILLANLFLANHTAVSWKTEKEKNPPMLVFLSDLTKD